VKVEKRHVSLTSLVVVSLIAVCSLLFDLRTDGEMTPWGMRALGLTLVTVVLGAAAEMLTKREEIQKERELALKESERDLTLRSVESHARAANAPMMPFSLFFTLRHYCPPETVQKVFKDKDGYRSLSPALKLVSVAELGSHGIYNTIEEEPSESHCTLKGDELSEVIESAPGLREYVTKSISSCQISLFLPDSEKEPSLSLRTKFPEDKPRYVQRLQLFDDVIYEDAYFDGWEVTNYSGKSWSVYDLVGARLEIAFRILSFDDNLQKPPRLHNLHLYFGRPTPYVLFFKADQLLSPFVGEATNPVIVSNFYKPLALSYDLKVTQELFLSQVKQIF
jgi:hypothetical protein